MTNGEAEKIKQLEQDIKYWSTTAQNYLTTLQSEQAENENLKELLKNQSPGKVNEEAEKSLIWHLCFLTKEVLPFRPMLQQKAELLSLQRLYLMNGQQKA